MLARKPARFRGVRLSSPLILEGELRLWENLATMLPERSTLDRLTAMQPKREWQRLDGEARREIAIPARCRRTSGRKWTKAGIPPRCPQTMRAEIRQLERQMQQRLFALLPVSSTSLLDGVGLLVSSASSAYRFDCKSLGFHTASIMAGSSLVFFVQYGFLTCTCSTPLRVSLSAWAISGKLGCLLKPWARTLCPCPCSPFRALDLFQVRANLAGTRHPRISSLHSLLAAPRASVWLPVP